VIRMAGVATTREIDRQLAELERQRTEGEISEITFTVRRNLLLTRAEQSVRRRHAALRVMPPPPPPPPPYLHRAPAQPRVNRRAILWMLGLAAVATLLVLVYKLGSSTAPSPSSPGQSAAPPVSATAAPSSSPALPTSPPAASSRPSGRAQPTPGAPSSSSMTIHETQATATGGSVTLLGYADHFSPVSEINNPLPAGGFYAAVELQVCAGGQAGTVVSPFDFLLLEPDQSKLGVATGPAEGLQPQLSLTQVATGHCVSGWLSYGVTARPSALVDVADNLTWSIP